jgi:hypothetical protein
MSSTEPLDDPVLQEAIHRFTARAFSNTPGATSQETAALQDGLRQILHNEEIPGTELSQILAEDEFRWGVWVEVEEASFRRYLELWDATAPDEPPFRCRLSAVLPGYPDTDTLEGDARLRGANARPVIYLRAEDHPLVREQKSGITMARVHEILESAMPQLFPRAGER